MILFLQREGKEMSVTLAPGDRVMDLLDRSGIMPDGVLVLREGVPLPLDENVEGTSRLTVIRVASGG